MMNVYITIRRAASLRSCIKFIFTVFVPATLKVLARDDCRAVMKRIQFEWHQHQVRTRSRAEGLVSRSAAPEVIAIARIVVHEAWVATFELPAVRIQSQR